MRAALPKRSSARSRPRDWTRSPGSIKGITDTIKQALTAAGLMHPASRRAAAGITIDGTAREVDPRSEIMRCADCARRQRSHRAPARRGTGPARRIPRAVRSPTRPERARTRSTYPLPMRCVERADADRRDAARLHAIAGRFRRGHAHERAGGRARLRRGLSRAIQPAPTDRSAGTGSAPRIRVATAASLRSSRASRARSRRAMASTSGASSWRACPPARQWR